MPRKRSVDWKTLIKKNSRCIQLETPILITDSVKFRCYCGNIFETTIHKVGSGHTKSCGCARGRKFQGGKYICQDFFGRLARGAAIRSIEVNITIQDIEDQLQSQDFKCALTGRSLVFGFRPIAEYTASVDRIDSKLGYLKNNIQILHKDVNFSKQSYSQDEFILMCKEVAEHNK